MNIYNPKSGITQNMSEGFNTVMRRVNEWEEASVDIFILTLYQLQTFYVNSITLGRTDRGDYTLLRNEFPYLIMTGILYIYIDIIHSIHINIYILAPFISDTYNNICTII